MPQCSATTSNVQDNVPPQNRPRRSTHQHVVEARELTLKLPLGTAVGVESEEEEKDPDDADDWTLGFIHLREYQHWLKACSQQASTRHR